MTEERNYRHELKYIVSASELSVLENRIHGLIPLDRNSMPQGYYTIRSLYFDDIQNTCYYENESGADPREKFRIRIYNHSLDHISLECKRKERGKTLKTACPLTLEQAQQLMQGIVPPDFLTQDPLLRKLCLQMLQKQLHPTVIVEYDRIPYVNKAGNVRITFDKNIASSTEATSFFDETIPRRMVMPAGTHILEVKYDEFLPDYIYSSLAIENLMQTAFSKYYICRKIHN